MKKTAAVIAALSAFTFANVYADTLSVPLKNEPNKDAKQLSKVEANTPLVKIFQKDGWVKVGVQSNGDVGWINLDAYRDMQTKTQQAQIKQYEKSLKTLMQENAQPLIVSQTKDAKSTKDGKNEPQTNITVKKGEKDGVKYKIVQKTTQYNGDDLKQANDMMKHFWAAQQQMQQRFNQAFQQMNRQFMSDPFIQMEPGLQLPSDQKNTLPKKSDVKKDNS